MPHDPVRVAEVGEWLLRARQDIRAAAVLLGSAAPLADAAVFHCQQAAEKAFKAFLTWHDQPFRKTHNLEELGEQCLRIDSSLETIVDHAVPLTEYAWRFRYPGDPEHVDQMEAEEARALAQEVYDAIVYRLPEDVSEGSPGTEV